MLCFFQPCKATENTYKEYFTSGVHTSSFQSVGFGYLATSLPLKPRLLPFSLLCSQIVLQVFLEMFVEWIASVRNRALVHDVTYGKLFNL